MFRKKPGGDENDDKEETDRKRRDRRDGDGNGRFVIIRKLFGSGNSSIITNENSERITLPPPPRSCMKQISDCDIAARVLGLRAQSGSNQNLSHLVVRNKTEITSSFIPSVPSTSSGEDIVIINKKSIRSSSRGRFGGNGRKNSFKMAMREGIPKEKNICEIEEDDKNRKSQDKDSSSSNSSANISVSEKEVNLDRNETRNRSSIRGRFRGRKNSLEIIKSSNNVTSKNTHTEVSVEDIFNKHHGTFSVSTNRMGRKPWTPDPRWETIEYPEPERTHLCSGYTACSNNTARLRNGVILNAEKLPENLPQVLPPSLRSRLRKACINSCICKCCCGDPRKRENVQKCKNLDPPKARNSKRYKSQVIFTTSFSNSGNRIRDRLRGALRSCGHCPDPTKMKFLRPRVSLPQHKATIKQKPVCYADERRPR